jgi:hypothetical protein
VYYYSNVLAADDALVLYSPTKKGIFATPLPHHNSSGSGGISSKGYRLNDLNIFMPSYKH